MIVIILFTFGLIFVVAIITRIRPLCLLVFSSCLDSDNLHRTEAFIYSAEWLVLDPLCMSRTISFYFCFIISIASKYLLSGRPDTEITIIISPNARTNTLIY